MMKMLLAAVAAFALVQAAPAFAACPDCKDCPKHKVAANEKAEKKDAAPAAAGCKCATAQNGECKCPAGKCECPHCHPAEKKEAPKKS